MRPALRNLLALSGLAGFLFFVVPIPVVRSWIDIANDGIKSLRAARTIPADARHGSVESGHPIHLPSPNNCSLPGGLCMADTFNGRVINVTGGPSSFGGDVTITGKLASSGGEAALTCAAGGSVSVAASTCPSVGQVLTATGANTATWQNASGGVPTSRQINTTAPLAGGGDLTADRTITIAAAGGGLAGSMSGADKTKLDTYPGSGAANALANATTQVSTVAAAAPTTGQVLTATGANAATWQTPAAGGATPLTTWNHEGTTSPSVGTFTQIADAAVIGFSGTVNTTQANALRMTCSDGNYNKWAGYATQPMTSEQYTVEGIFRPAAGSSGNQLSYGIAARVPTGEVPSTDGILFYAYNDGAGTSSFYLSKAVTGVLTGLTSAPLASIPNFSQSTSSLDLKLIVDSGWYTGYVNGVLVVRAYDAQFNGAPGRAFVGINSAPSGVKTEPIALVDLFQVLSGANYITSQGPIGPTGATGPSGTTPNIPAKDGNTYLRWNFTNTAIGDTSITSVGSNTLALTQNGSVPWTPGQSSMSGPWKSAYVGMANRQYLQGGGGAGAHPASYPVTFYVAFRVVALPVGGIYGNIFAKEARNDNSWTAPYQPLAIAYNNVGNGQWISCLGISGTQTCRTIDTPYKPIIGSINLLSFTYDGTTMKTQSNGVTVDSFAITGAIDWSTDGAWTIGDYKSAGVTAGPAYIEIIYAGLDDTIRSDATLTAWYRQTRGWQ